MDITYYYCPSSLSYISSCYTSRAVLTHLLQSFLSQYEDQGEDHIRSKFFRGLWLTFRREDGLKVNRNILHKVVIEEGLSHLHRYIPPRCLHLKLHPGPEGDLATQQVVTWMNYDGLLHVWM